MVEFTDKGVIARRASSQHLFELKNTIISSSDTETAIRSKIVKLLNQGLDHNNAEPLFEVLSRLVWNDMMKAIIEEYKKFALKGNVLDMAVGIVVGGAFATISSSFVDNLISPILGLITSGVDMADLFWVLKSGPQGGEYVTLEAANKDGAVTLSYGLLINALFSFFIVSWFAFLLVKGVNHVHQKEKIQEEKEVKECLYCYSSIDKRATKCSFCASELKELPSRSFN